MRLTARFGPLQARLGQAPAVPLVAVPTDRCAYTLQRGGAGNRTPVSKRPTCGFHLNRNQFTPGKSHTQSLTVYRRPPRGVVS